MNNITTKISFIDKPFDAIICLNADIPGRDDFSGLFNIPLFAADGAANKLAEIDIVPDLVLGDLDSLSDQARQRIPERRIVHLPDQEMNDFEKILRFCIGENLERLLITGIHGGDLEHTLNNISVLMKFAGQLNLTVLDKKRYAIPVCYNIEIPVSPGETISLLPQPRCRLTTRNLKWPLNNEVLELGNREGARNEALAESIEIKLHKGAYILFLDSRTPLTPEFDE